MSFHSTSRRRQRTSAEAPVSSGILQRKCAHSQHTMDGDLYRRQATDQSTSRIVPPIVHDVIRLPGQSLDTAARPLMESFFNHDFSRIQVHTGASAARSARAINARAYTVHNDVVFGEGQYQPTSGRGRRLIAHELAHVVQQNRGGNSAAVEVRADRAAERVAHNQAVTPEIVGGASPGLYADNGEEEGTSTAEPASTLVTQPAFSVGWADLARINTFQLTPPSLLTPPLRRLTLGSPLLSSPTPPLLSVPGLPPPLLMPEPAFFPPSTPDLRLPPSTPSAETEAPPLPSRLPVLNSGRFSLGLRLGFPKLEQTRIPGMPESALAESLRRAEIMNQMLTGNVPSGWEAVEKTQLVQAIWGIFSTNIAPDLARSITSGLSTPAGPAGVSYELDLVLLTDFSSEIGGGLSFTVRYPSLESLFTGR